MAAPSVESIQLVTPLVDKHVLAEDVSLIQLLSPSDAVLLSDYVKTIASDEERAAAGIDLTRSPGLEGLWARISDALDTRLQAMVDKKAVKCKARLVSAIYIEFRDVGHTMKGPHYDDNDITLNLCLHNGATGGRVTFMGRDMTTDGFRSIADQMTGGIHDVLPRLTITHESGVACLHFGRHAHATEVVKAGLRSNVVIKYDYKAFGLFGELPPELQLSVLSACDIKTLGRACSASKALKELADDEWLWYQLYTGNTRLQSHLSSPAVEVWKAGGQLPTDCKVVFPYAFDTSKPCGWKHLYYVVSIHANAVELNAKTAAERGDFNSEGTGTYYSYDIESTSDY